MVHRAWSTAAVQDIPRNDVPVVAEIPYALPDVLINFTNSVVMTLAMTEAIPKLSRLTYRTDISDGCWPQGPIARDANTYQEDDEFHYRRRVLRVKARGWVPSVAGRSAILRCSCAGN